MNRDDADRFIDHLQSLNKNDHGALAALRHSLAFDPGDDPRSYPFVERWVSRLVGRNAHARDARRLALYAVAGLFALHPVVQTRSLAAALGQLLRDKDRPSLELRFRALLESDADSAMAHLRQSVNLLAADGLGWDPAALLLDLCWLLDERADPKRRDSVRRQWARQFYGALQADDERETSDATATEQPATQGEPS